MNKKFRKALKISYDIPKPVRKEEFLNSIDKVLKNKLQHRRLIIPNYLLSIIASVFVLLIFVGYYYDIYDKDYNLSDVNVESSIESDFKEPELTDNFYNEKTNADERADLEKVSQDRKISEKNSDYNTDTTTVVTENNVIEEAGSSVLKKQNSSGNTKYIENVPVKNTGVYKEIKPLVSQKPNNVNTKPTETTAVTRDNENIETETFVSRDSDKPIETMVTTNSGDKVVTKPSVSKLSDNMGDISNEFEPIFTNVINVPTLTQPVNSDSKDDLSTSIKTTPAASTTTTTTVAVITSILQDAE